MRDMKLISCTGVGVYKSDTLWYIFTPGSQVESAEILTILTPPPLPQASYSTWSFTFDSHKVFSHRSRSVAVVLPHVMNQSNLYSANIPGVARLSSATARLVFKYKVLEAILYHQQAVGHTGVYRGKAKSKRYVLRRLLKVATEVAELTDSGKVVPRRRGTRAEGPCASVGPDPRDEQSDPSV